MTEDTSNQTEVKRIGDYLVCSPGTLRNAVKKQGQLLKHGKSLISIGQTLVKNGDITQEELDAAIKKQRVARLRNCPVFENLSDSELAALSTHFTEVSVPMGQQFIIQDDPDPTLYILATGKVQVYRMDLEGNETHIAYVEPPEPIGEMGYFSGGNRTASVRAIEPTDLLHAEYSDLTHYFENVPHVAHAFLKIVEQRRKATEDIIQQQNK
ncbi:MAG: cyclic nucleotide-binding domain-containing protein [Proteobacteria bacterium]|nr:cyclic nucleotide-binding domain-containing protein [Pseudomonadota bacterium]